MNAYDLFATRKSVRGYDAGRQVPGEVLERVLDACRLAPSAKNLQPWRIIVVSSPEMLQRVRPCYDREWFRQAPHILIIAGSRSDAWVRPSDGWNSLETDLAIAMDHLVLAAHGEGLATCWVCAFDPAMLREAIGLRQGEEVFAITPLGYASVDAETRPKTRKTLDEIIEHL